MVIKTAIDFLRDKLSTYITQKTGDDETVILANLASGTGTAPTANSSKLIVTLVNLEEERVGRVQGSLSNAENGRFFRQNPPVKLNLYVMFAADPFGSGTYGQALGLVSHTIEFFQANLEFTPENSPELDPAIDKLIMDLYTFPIEQQNYLWGSLGTSYHPNVIYRVRLVTVQEQMPINEVGEINTIEINAQNN